MQAIAYILCCLPVICRQDSRGHPVNAQSPHWLVPLRTAPHPPHRPANTDHKAVRLCSPPGLEPPLCLPSIAAIKPQPPIPRYFSAIDE